MVNDLLSFLPDNERLITISLRDIVLETIPKIREKLSYNVPFYSVQRRICFIWPSAIPWGKVRSGGVQFGFCQGYLLVDPEHYLDITNRKQVFSKTIFEMQDIEEEKLKSLLLQALDIDNRTTNK